MYRTLININHLLKVRGRGLSTVHVLYLWYLGSVPQIDVFQIPGSRCLLFYEVGPRRLTHASGKRTNFPSNRFHRSVVSIAFRSLSRRILQASLWPFSFQPTSWHSCTHCFIIMEFLSIDIHGLGRLDTHLITVPEEPALSASLQRRFALAASVACALAVDFCRRAVDLVVQAEEIVQWHGNDLAGYK